MTKIVVTGGSGRAGRPGARAPLAGRRRGRGTPLRSLEEGQRMTKIVVTGGSGRAGRPVVRDLLEHGHQVLNVDLIQSVDPVAPWLPADLTDLGQTIEALSGAEVMPGA